MKEVTDKSLRTAASVLSKVFGVDVPTQEALETLAEGGIDRAFQQMVIERVGHRGLELADENSIAVGSKAILAAKLAWAYAEAVALFGDELVASDWFRARYASVVGSPTGVEDAIEYADLAISKIRRTVNFII